MCCKKIKQWKMWNWRVFQWIKTFFRWVKKVLTHRKTKKVYSFLENTILILVVGSLAFGLIIAVMSGIAFANRPDYSYQHEGISLTTNDYFLLTYNLEEDYVWDIELSINTPNTNFILYIFPTNSFNFAGDVPIIIGLQSSYTINHRNYWRVYHEITSSESWSCLIINYDVSPAEFDLASNLITSSQWIVYLHNVVKTISDYWLIPIFTVASLVFVVREISKKRSENNNSTNNQTSTNPP